MGECLLNHKLYRAMLRCRTRLEMPRSKYHVQYACYSSLKKIRSPSTLRDSELQTRFLHHYDAAAARRGHVGHEPIFGQLSAFPTFCLAMLVDRPPGGVAHGIAHGLVG